MGRESKRERMYVCVHVFSHAFVSSSFATPGTVVRQAPRSMEVSKQEHWTGLPFPPPGDDTNPWIEPVSVASPALAGRFFATEPPGKPTYNVWLIHLSVQ